jgi:hypothetical protein
MIKAALSAIVFVLSYYDASVFFKGNYENISVGALF